MMINETASEEIGRTDELPAGSTGRSRKRDGIEDDDEQIDHIARIQEFFSKDSVIKFVLVVQFVIAVLSYGMLNYVFRYLYNFYHGTLLTLPLPTRLVLIIFSTDYYLVSISPFFEAYSISFAGVYYFIPYVVMFFIISMPFTGIYHLFRKRKKLFFYYFFATFPQEMVVLLASCFLALAIHPLFEIFGQMK